MPGGIWNEDELPVLEWEAAEHRVVLPDDLQRVLGIGKPVLRWSVKKYRAVVGTHNRDLHVVHDLARYLARWEYAGEETGVHEGNWRVLVRDEIGRWYAVSIGTDATGSMNVITLVGSGTRGFLSNRLRSLKNVVER